ncbi:Uncharacterized membrane protein YsdA, DUF1294 family [Anaerobranca californiensis DSM 14826]|jgi:uncharacterized membrane protein YsdA (DUF1294 family)|uniref:Uncharacterized membrane protein YsdA, DUF1294 family n=1 Tax=Anaerobranca californiensis DSM 14826 TaxID=1120989 RepID=A0A1M6R661_9FIRM|nr:DUF1294 domain-containing protein [Anaerobranca californiensis]SHK27933.1 Uncharacterized membrane protein YsdA, DUF1294 family [Anaerobranca californiensis DSM 14826]
MEKIILAYGLFINIIGFLKMYSDKRRAIKGKWRIKENKLFLIAIIGGSLGIYIGMKVWRHKTRDVLFKHGIPLLIVVQLILFVILSLNT